MNKILGLGILGIAGYVGYRTLSSGKDKKAKVGSQMGVGGKKGLKKTSVAPTPKTTTKKTVVKKTPSDDRTYYTTSSDSSDSSDSTVTNVSNGNNKMSKKENGVSKKFTEPTAGTPLKPAGTYKVSHKPKKNILTKKAEEKGYISEFGW